MQLGWQTTQKVAVGGYQAIPWARSFVRDYLLGGKPLFYETLNPTWASFVRSGVRGHLPPTDQAAFNSWWALPVAQRRVQTPLNLTRKVVSFNEPLRKRIYATTAAGAAITAMHAVAFRQDPNTEVADMSDNMGYGATGDYSLSSYYNNKG